jgi:hypothetical protein
MPGHPRAAEGDLDPWPAAWELIGVLLEPLEHALGATEMSGREMGVDRVARPLEETWLPDPCLAR